MWRRLPCFPGAKATILSRIRNILQKVGSGKMQLLQNLQQLRQTK